jgi:hypothetical protein
MTTLQLTPAQHAILAYAIEHTGGKIEWFPDNIKGGARTKVLEGLFNKALINRDSTDWFVTADGYDALGRARPEPSSMSATANEQTALTANEPEPARAGDAYDRAVVATKEGAALREKTEEAIASVRNGSKLSIIIEHLRSGATCHALAEATGWQQHTIRAILCDALPKRGITIIADKPEGQRHKVYRLAYSS